MKERVYRSDYGVLTVDLQKSQETSVDADLKRMYLLESYYAWDMNGDVFRDKILCDPRLRVYYLKIEKLIDRGSRERWDEWRYIRFISHYANDADIEMSLTISVRQSIKIKKQTIWKILISTLRKKW